MLLLCYSCILPFYELMYLLVMLFVSVFFFFRPWKRALVFLLTHSSWRIRQTTQSCIQRLFNISEESALELQSSLLAEFSELLAMQKVK